MAFQHGAEQEITQASTSKDLNKLIVELPCRRPDCESPLISDPAFNWNAYKSRHRLACMMSNFMRRGMRLWRGLVNSRLSFSSRLLRHRSAFRNRAGIFATVHIRNENALRRRFCICSVIAIKKKRTNQYNRNNDHPSQVRVATVAVVASAMVVAVIKKETCDHQDNEDNRIHISGWCSTKKEKSSNDCYTTTLLTAALKP